MRILNRPEQVEQKPVYTWTAAAELVLSAAHLKEVLKQAQETQIGD